MATPMRRTTPQERRRRRTWHSPLTDWRGAAGNLAVRLRQRLFFERDDEEKLRAGGRAGGAKADRLELLEDEPGVNRRSPNAVEVVVAIGERVCRRVVADAHVRVMRRMVLEGDEAAARRRRCSKAVRVVVVAPQLLGGHGSRRPNRRLRSSAR